MVLTYNIALISLTSGASARPFPPLGLLYLARAILNRLDNWNVDIIEQDNPSDQFYSSGFWDFIKVVEAVQRKRSEVVGISCVTITLPLALRIAEEIKKNDPTTLVVLGGPGPSGRGERILRRFPVVDFVVDGEGETSLVDLLKAVEKDENQIEAKGVFYRNKGEVCYNGPQERVECLDDLDFPAYELVNMKTYEKYGIIWHRGCPYNCSFCDVSKMWGRKVSSRSMNHVIQEIEMLKTQFGAQEIHFFDDTFTLRKEDTLHMCERLEEMDINWTANCRINTVDRELLEKMVDAGCKGIFYGIESGSDRVLKMINKRIRVEDAITVIKKTPPQLSVKVSFIWNYPFETLDDFYKTFFLISYLFSQGIQVRYTPLSLLLQSSLYREYKGKLITDKNKNIRWNNMLNQNLLNRSGVSTPKWANDLIFEHSDIFPGLLWIDSPNIDEKIKFVRRYMQVMGQF
ncbi:MAG: B12-binding domain-containing radical SAM protein [Theionarchaea archaeon]|nr:B12-binding domain-containing radical SAM protein [Theionarchaea archaeon]